MLRQARIDACLCVSARRQAPGALHHILIRGIEQRGIFEDDKDREDFPEQLSNLVQEIVTPWYAWALMTNYAHLLFRAGTAPIASIMRRLR